MSLLQTYIDGLRAGDASLVASIFSEDALFNDEAPVAMGMDPIVLNGRAAIEENFGAMLGGGGLNLADVCILDNVMRYDIVIAEGMVVKALGVATVKDGQVVEYQVRAPAAE